MRLSISAGRSMGIAVYIYAVLYILYRLHILFIILYICIYIYYNIVYTHTSVYLHFKCKSQNPTSVYYIIDGRASAAESWWGGTARRRRDRLRIIRLYDYYDDATTIYIYYTRRCIIPRRDERSSLIGPHFKKFLQLRPCVL